MQIQQASAPGITPACAGKMSLSFIARMILLGSPPHARGKSARRRCLSLPQGITPACAGKMRRSLLRARSSRDHPRMRGENPLCRFSRPAPPGSPPHARGKWHTAQGLKWSTGITPACAGKILHYVLIFKSGRDHPRMRGENVSSSPCHLSHGITPACAGKIFHPLFWANGYWDHPRMRGENPQ